MKRFRGALFVHRGKDLGDGHYKLAREGFGNSSATRHRIPGRR